MWFVSQWASHARLSWQVCQIAAVGSARVTCNIVTVTSLFWPRTSQPDHPQHLTHPSTICQVQAFRRDCPPPTLGTVFPQHLRLHHMASLGFPKSLWFPHPVCVSVCLSMCVCACVSVCMCLCVETRGQPQVCLLKKLHTGSLTGLGPRMPWNLPVPVLSEYATPHLAF